MYIVSRLMHKANLQVDVELSSLRTRTKVAKIVRSIFETLWVKLEVVLCNYSVSLSLSLPLSLSLSFSLSLSLSLSLLRTKAGSTRTCTSSLLGRYCFEISSIRMPT